MLSNGTDDRLRASLIHRLRESRVQTDHLFHLLAPAAIHDRPIRERHRIIFYLGHLEAFDWNLIGRRTFGLDPFDEYFDNVFAFGIDPVDGDLPSDTPSDWPLPSQIASYNRRVREAVDGLLDTTGFDDDAGEGLSDGLIFHVAIEHRLMHAETLAYMYHQLPLDRKRPQPERGNVRSDPQVEPRQVEIPVGTATLGMKPEKAFGWDNEFDLTLTEVPGFTVDVHNITNGQFMEFVQAGGYEDRSLWDDTEWEWVTREDIQHPRFWRQNGNGWQQCNMFDERPLPSSWPVYVSHAEASAYSRWVGRTLPTEAQLHRAAYGTPDGKERAFPWGEAPPEQKHGNFDFCRWNPTPVGAYPAGDSAFGVADLVGNGWEWTSTVFEPFEGFERFPFYPGYSADFFDGKHFVMKGGSPRTAACMLRRSFRNWFQPHYPHIYSTFRCVEA